MRTVVRVPRSAVVTDRVLLTIPSDADYRSVATLVLGGIGSRMNLPYERLDDLSLALESALESALDGTVTIEFGALDPDGLELAIGPLRSGSGRDDALTLVLSRLVDGVRHELRDGVDWLVLRTAPSGAAA
jgi:hypothetical protein